MNTPKKTSNIIHLNVRHLWAFCDLHPILREIVGVGMDLIPSKTQRITSIDRTFTEDKALKGSGVHADGPPWRAVDIAWDNMTQSQIDNVCSHINSLYQYDLMRPTKVVAYGAPHGTGLHIHFQVHSNTRRIS